MDFKNISLALILYLPFSALAQQSETTIPAISALEPEEIQILGKQSLPQLRQQLLSAEKNAYDIFNKFNDEKRFKILCSTYRPTGAHFESQKCQPTFEIEATSAHGREFLETYRTYLEPYAIIGGGGISTNGSASPASDMSALIASQQGAYRKKIRQVAEEHPEFLDAIIKYSETREKYEEALKAGRNDD